MARTTGNNGKLTSGNRAAVRLTLAAGVTLVTLMSAEMFAAGASVQTSSAVSASSAITSQTSAFVQSSAPSLVITTRRHSNIFSTQTQPIPGSRSSR